VDGHGQHHRSLPHRAKAGEQETLKSGSLYGFRCCMVVPRNQPLTDHGEYGARRSDLQSLKYNETVEVVERWFGARGTDGVCAECVQCRTFPSCSFMRGSTGRLCHQNFPESLARIVPKWSFLAPRLCRRPLIRKDLVGMPALAAAVVTRQFES
jgi:hypothetical protein